MRGPIVASDLPQIRLLPTPVGACSIPSVKLQASTLPFAAIKTRNAVFRTFRVHMTTQTRRRRPSINLPILRLHRLILEAHPCDPSSRQRREYCTRYIYRRSCIVLGQLLKTSRVTGLIASLGSTRAQNVSGLSRFPRQQHNPVFFLFDPIRHLFKKKKVHSRF